MGGVNFDAGNYSAICLADWNNDGLIDVLSGESHGRVWLLVNAGAPGSPLFPSAAFVKDGGGDLSVGGVSCPSVGDWNRDGKKDLICGETYGTLFFFENKGSDADPVFIGSEKLKTGYYPGNFTIDLGFYSRPHLVDWDGDGVPDILSGCGGGHVWIYRAMGPLFLSQNYIIDSTGASIDMELIAGTANAGRSYLVLGSASGTEPGIKLPGGLVLPLNWDPFLHLVLGLLNTPVFSGFMGVIPPSGMGGACFNAPAGTGLSGITLHFAYCLGSPFDFVSNGAAVEILP